MKEKCFCRNCKGMRNQKVLHEVKRHGGDSEGAFQWTDGYAIIECGGCETISFLNTYSDSDMLKYNKAGEPIAYDYERNIYPNYLVSVGELTNTYYIPTSIRNIYKETISALKANLHLLTAGGLRAVIEAVCNHLKIEGNKLADRINLLHEKGHLTIKESKRLHSIRFLGNDALHELEIPKKEHLYLLLDIVNHLLANLFISDNNLKTKIDTIIDTYDEFTRLIQNRVSKDLIGREITIRQLLGKAIRLIPKKSLALFESQFHKEISKGFYKFISIVSNGTNKKYKIESEPEFLIEWLNFKN